MAAKTRTVCNVCETNRRIRAVIVSEQIEDAETGRKWDGYLCPRCEKRLHRFLDRGFMSVTEWQDKQRERNDAK